MNTVQPSNASFHNNVTYDKLYVHKYEKHFPKMLRDVGMAAVPKTTQTRYMDGSVQATQRTTQVTPYLHLFFFHFCYPFPVISQQGLDTCSIQKKKDVGMGLLV